MTTAENATPTEEKVVKKATRAKKEVAPKEKAEVKTSKVSVKKEPVKAGASVKLLVGKEKGKVFTVKKISGDKVFLDGYKLIKRTVKVSQENPNNYRTVHHYVHISNVTTKTDK